MLYIHVLHGHWASRKTDEGKLGVFERKILGKSSVQRGITTGSVK